MDSEQRLARRLPVELHVRVHAADGHDSILLSHDWSRFGVFLRTRRPLPLGTHVALYVVLPGASTPIEMEGVVVRRIEEGEPAVDRPPGMALHLGEIPAPLRDYLGLLGRAGSGEPVELLPSPVVLLVGGEAAQRARYAEALDAAGLDVNEADLPGSARALTCNDLRPDVVIVFEPPGGSRTVQTLRELPCLPYGPAVTIVLGGPPAGLESIALQPIVVLPVGVAGEQMLAVVALFLQREGPDLPAAARA